MVAQPLREAGATEGTRYSSSKLTAEGFPQDHHPGFPFVARAHEWRRYYELIKQASP
jgi:hypothetical protein